MDCLYVNSHRWNSKKVKETLKNSRVIFLEFSFKKLHT